jgi:hypothetical protein
MQRACDDGQRSRGSEPARPRIRHAVRAWSRRAVLVSLRVARASRSFLIVDRFAPEGERLRAHFEARFAEPRRADAGRFVWDHWHVPGQYTQLRTPAWRYFPKPVYEAFHRRLVDWGRRTLGCHDVSPPWLSCYVDGCRQELHGDLPHGPWAFVYSLTPWAKRSFRGGETLILRDEVLDWWSAFTSTRSIEEGDVLHAIEPKFDRLVVFDPRVPHGVRRVDGPADPRAGRLVINGWFVQPRPFIAGTLPLGALQAGIDELGRVLAPMLADAPPIAGLLSVAFRVRKDGAVDELRVLSDTTRAPAAAETLRRRLVATVVRTLRARAFPRSRSASRVTLPLVFER